MHGQATISQTLGEKSWVLSPGHFASSAFFAISVIGCLHLLFLELPNCVTEIQVNPSYPLNLTYFHLELALFKIVNYCHDYGTLNSVLFIKHMPFFLL